MMLRLSFIALATLLLSGTACAQSRDPRLPPGTDPGGAAIALISTGVDYTDPALAKMLARDGEGDLIGWDFVDNDNRPFDVSRGKTPPHQGGDGTALARIIDGFARIVAIRVNPTDPAHLANAVAFAARTPARVVVVPMWSRSKEQWEPFGQAAAHFRDLLIIVAAGDDGVDLDREPVWPAALALPNFLVVNAAARHGEHVTLIGNRSSRLVDLSVIPVEDIQRGRAIASQPTDTRRAAIETAWAVSCGHRLGQSPLVALMKGYLLGLSTPNPHGGSKAIYTPQACVLGPRQF